MLYILPWEVSPTVILVCLAAGVAYARGLSALKARGETVGFWQPLSFFLGLTLDYVMLQTYYDYLSQHMFWVHRLQHLVLHHLAPVLLVLAAPGSVMAAGVPTAWRERGVQLAREGPLRWLLRLGTALFRFAQHPLVAPLLFVGLIFFWLTPSIHFAAMLDIDRYRTMNWGMAVDGILFWWLMLAPRRSQGRAAIGYPLRILIVCLVALPQILLGAYIALHSTVLFDVYEICGRAWNVSPLTDQELGGLLTWIPAAMMSGVAMLVILRRLLIEEGEKTPAAAPQPTRAAAIARHTLALAAVALVLTVAGCGASEPPYGLSNVKGLLPRLEFNLTDQDGRPVTADDYRGKIVLLYFGYTNCPDACPTTLTTLADVMHRLGPDAAKVRVLFVTVDPQRDTASVLKRYVGFFGTQFVGLRGDEHSLTTLTKRYRVAYHREPPDSHGYYAVDHSSAVFIFDARGRARLLAREGDGAQLIAQDLRRLAAQA